MSFTIGMMVILHKFPEWYVVNSVGVLVGSGVITMIGIAFVPVLVIFFMILAAVYDHWAVNKSKHMLELADTMIDLKLPVLLVAPKSSNYSFIDQESNVMRRGEDVGMSWEGPLNGEVVPKSQAKGRDALFMGLGDVIFPGILVISSITFLPDIGPVVFDFWGDPSEPVHLGPMLVGLGTLAGGLVGYMALMTQVARGRPQAGLPLLNGGSILGYIISGTIALGFNNLWQDITFL
jgi:presenilin-like A22 family membrane protease